MSEEEKRAITMVIVVLYALAEDHLSKKACDDLARACELMGIAPEDIGR